MEAILLALAVLSQRGFNCEPVSSFDTGFTGTGYTSVCRKNYIDKGMQFSETRGLRSWRVSGVSYSDDDLAPACGEIKSTDTQDGFTMSMDCFYGVRQGDFVHLVGMKNLLFATIVKE